MTNEVKTILAAESKPQLDAVRDFMGTLDMDGQKSLLDFFCGAKFMQNLMTAGNQAAPPSAPAEPVRPSA